MRSAIEREKRQARGIVIRHGAFTHERSAFWAYLWSEELIADEPQARSRDAKIPSPEPRPMSLEK